MRNFPSKDKRRDFVRCNEQIRVPKVRLVHDGNNLGIKLRDDALRMAREASLDLIEIAPNANPPVCSIMDYGKYMFDKQKKDKDARQSTGPKEKEISFRYVISDHDLETKANQIKSLLAKGFKIKVVVKFKSREKAHKDQGFVAVQRLIDLLAEEAVVEKRPSLEGNSIIAKLDAKKGAKDGVKPQGSNTTAKPDSGVREGNPGSDKTAQ